MFLAGDVGGTKTRLALFELANGSPVRGATEQFKSADHPNLQTIIAQFLSKNGASVRYACVGVPGPVQNGVVQITNLPWKLSEREIEAHCGLTRMKLVNDLVATAAAIPHFAAQDVIEVYAGKPKENPLVSAVIAPGTGLGQGFLSRDPETKQYQVLASEGGHAGFAPTNELEAELLMYLTKRYGRGSVEHVLCGPGIVNVYSFLIESGHAEEPPALRAELDATPDKAAVIGRGALSGEYSCCVKAAEIFLSALGSHAGNMALTVLATGGIYLGGGIPPRIIPLLLNGIFVRSFLAKGKLSHVVEATPVYIIKDDYAALTGAANLASQLMQ